MLKDLNLQTKQAHLGRQYILEEDIRSIKAPVDPSKQVVPDKPSKVLTKEEKKAKREAKEKEIFESKPEEDPNMTAEQRDKTIDLMIKLLGRHIEDAKEEANELNKFFKKTETKIKGFEAELKREEVQVLIDDIKRRKAIAERDMEESLAEAELIRSDRDPKLEDCLIQNELLLAEVDNYINMHDPTVKKKRSPLSDFEDR